MENLRIDPTIAYDVVELPSRGIYYDNNIKSLRVSYLTAADENILTSQNLINSNGVINELLRNKILDKNFNVDDLVEEDRQAILIFLRNTAFGSEYKLTITDPKTNLPFNETIDLSLVSMKDFTLVPNENGEYNYKMNSTNADITFKFLNKSKQNELIKIQNEWNGNGVPPVKTKELEFLIKSVNGSRDVMEIYKFIQQLPIKDSQEFRKFVNDNKPRLDLSQTVNTPSGEEITVEIGLGVEFFRPFYGL